jgi:phage terminase large subunit-like protein
VAQDVTQKWHVGCEFFAPLEGLSDRSHRDRVPYDLWHQRGLLTATPGASVDYGYVARRLIELQRLGELVSVRFDRWRIDVLKAELAREGAEIPLEPHGQGFRDMAPALDELESLLAFGSLRHGNHPILTNHAANAIAVADSAGNRKLDKAKSFGRIDGMVALAMAIAAVATHQAEPDISEFLAAPLKA